MGSKEGETEQLSTPFYAQREFSRVSWNIKGWWMTTQFAVSFLHNTTPLTHYHLPLKNNLSKTNLTKSLISSTIANMRFLAYFVAVSTIALANASPAKSSTGGADASAAQHPSSMNFMFLSEL